MTATRTVHGTKNSPVLYMAFELGWREWKLAFSVGVGQKPRLRSIRARNLKALAEEIASAKKRFKLSRSTKVRSCYEAGRDGFWLQRWLVTEGIENLVVDSSSIEVNRRARRAKSDRLDAVKLVTMLLRYHAGEHKVWSVVRIPSDAEEDGRELHRELESLKDERTRHINRIKGLLAGQGLSMVVDEDFLRQLAKLQRWDGSLVPAGLRARLQREYARLELLEQQIRSIENERKRLIRRDETMHVFSVQQKP